jgi:hypothetical protein
MSQCSKQILDRLISADTNLSMKDLFDSSTEDALHVDMSSISLPGLCTFAAEFCWDILMRISPLLLFSSIIPRATENWECVSLLIRLSPIARPQDGFEEHMHASHVHVVVERIVCLSHVWGSCSHDQLFVLLFKWLLRDRTTKELLEDNAGPGRSPWRYRSYHVPGNGGLRRSESRVAPSEYIFPFLDPRAHPVCCQSGLPHFLIDYGKSGVTIFDQSSTLLPSYKDSTSELMCKLLQMHVPKLKTAARGRVTHALLQLLPTQPLVVRHFPLDDVAPKEHLKDWRALAGNGSCAIAVKGPHEESVNNMLKLANLLAMQVTLSLANLLSDKPELDSTSRRWLKKRTSELALFLNQHESIVEASAIFLHAQWLLCCIYQDVNCQYGGTGEPAVGLVNTLRYAANLFDEMDKGTPGLKVSIIYPHLAA